MATTYTAPLRDMQFVLNEVLDISRYSNLPGFNEAPEDVVEAILEEGAKLASNVLHPINQSGDHEGCTRHDDGSVTTPKGCLLYTSPSPRDRQKSRMPSSA